MTTWYSVHFSRLSWLECWRFGGNPLTFLVAVGLKLSGHAMPGAGWQDDAWDLRTEDALPLELRARLDDGARAILALDAGFRRIGDRLAPCLKAGQPAGARIFLAADRGIAALVLAPSGGGSATFLAFASRKRDGTDVGTTTAPKKFDAVPGVRGEALPSASAAELLAAHRRLLDREGGATSFETFARDEDALVFLKANEDRCTEHRVKRGLFVAMSPAEIEAARGA